MFFVVVVVVKVSQCDFDFYQATVRCLLKLDEYFDFVSLHHVHIFEEAIFH